MSSESANATASRECLSALMDGELDDDRVAQACARWREEPSSREAWHAYQMIGDVLRSEDLATDARRDSAFVLALRERLAQEPVVLAPMPLPEPSAHGLRRRRGWMAPAAAAAGFAAVAVVVVVMRSGDGGVPLAKAPQPQLPALANPVVPVSTIEPTVITAPMIRDARLDRYLAAHQQFVGTSALGAQGFLRSATAESAGR